MGTASRSVEIDPACAAAEGSGDPGCGPAAQCGKEPFADGNRLELRSDQEVCRCSP